MAERAIVPTLGEHRDRKLNHRLRCSCAKRSGVGVREAIVPTFGEERDGFERSRD
jgi:hypothetical protein